MNPNNPISNRKEHAMKLTFRTMTLVILMIAFALTSCASTGSNTKGGTLTGDPCNDAAYAKAFPANCANFVPKVATAPWEIPVVVEAKDDVVDPKADKPKVKAGGWWSKTPEADTQDDPKADDPKADKPKVKAGGWWSKTPEADTQDDPAATSKVIVIKDDATLGQAIASQGILMIGIVFTEGDNFTEAHGGARKLVESYSTTSGVTVGMMLIDGQNVATMKPLGQKLLDASGKDLSAFKGGPLVFMRNAKGEWGLLESPTKSQVDNILRSAGVKL